MSGDHTQPAEQPQPAEVLAPQPAYTVVLGIAQDGGHPQAGCQAACCVDAWRDGGHLVSCLGLVDPESGRRWLVDATPDLPRQLHRLDELQPSAAPRPGLAGVFLTHAHMGHYTGLLHLGREVMGARDVPVYAMPQMRAFLASHGPWEQLVREGNLRLVPLEDGEAVDLGGGLQVTPFVVPHRREYTETVGFRIQGPQGSVAYLPDIDKWERWSEPVEQLLERHDRCYLDGTFFSAQELPGRDMGAVPHPFMVESMARFRELSPSLRARVHFIHLNHTNPALFRDSPQAREVLEAGLGLAREGEQTSL